MLATMQVGPVDWGKFQAAWEAIKDVPAPGRAFVHVYRSQSDPSSVLVIEEWDSHDSMHKYQDQVGDDFNRRAGTEGADWQVNVWETAIGA